MNSYSTITIAQITPFTVDQTAGGNPTTKYSVLLERPRQKGAPARFETILAQQPQKVECVLYALARAYARRVNYTNYHDYCGYDGRLPEDRYHRTLFEAEGKAVRRIRDFLSPKQWEAFAAQCFDILN